MEEEIKQDETMIERAEKAAQMLKEQNDRAETIASKNLLSGKSGHEEPPQPKELTAREYRLEVERRIANGEFE